MGNAAEELTALWDQVITEWLEGGSSVPDRLKPWFDVYSGSGRGQVDPEAFPEPFLGDLSLRPAGVTLALNPGEVFEEFQYRNGIFANEIRASGSYSKWAAGWPYLRAEGPRLPDGRGRDFHRKRLTFLRNWYGTTSIPPSRMIAFELYPWHSTGLTRSIIFRSQTARSFIERFIWSPIVDSRTPFVFGVGKDWFPVLRSFATQELVILGYDGEPCGFNESKRTVFVGRGPNGMLIIASKTHNVASPIPADDVDTLRTALLHRGILEEPPRYEDD
ncbi:MAG: hypothetical protein M3277_12105 [Actinomycetota bacterium]|nr:hypothetical protein [Actinomycetota bacterium]